MMGIQTEHAYQKQLTIFQNKKKVLLEEIGKEKLLQYYKNISLDSVWCGAQDEDAEDHCHLRLLPPLHLKIQPIQEMLQEHVCASVPLLLGCPDQ
uniref:Uncharacterized protein n=1 Tax=Lynx canadensis TaxID=61383 RepID=A0A667GD83_LYNCA